MKFSGPDSLDLLLLFNHALHFVLMHAARFAVLRVRHTLSQFVLMILVLAIIRRKARQQRREITLPKLVQFVDRRAEDIHGVVLSLCNDTLQLFLSLVIAQPKTTSNCWHLEKFNLVSVLFCVLMPMSLKKMVFGCYIAQNFSRMSRFSRKNHKCFMNKNLFAGIAKSSLLAASDSMI